LILSPPVGLDSEDPFVELILNQLVKFMKIMKHVRFVFQEIDPCKFVVIINERDIISETTKEVGIGPQTSKKLGSKGAFDSLNDL
jgi:hypothetical protein